MIDSSYNDYDPTSEMPGAFHEVPTSQKIQSDTTQKRPYVLKGNNSTIGGPHKIQSFIKKQGLYLENNDQRKTKLDDSAYPN